MAFTLDEDSALLRPAKVGDVSTANRLFMAPLTRSRAEADATPSELAALYYAQRASAGLIVSEATAVSAAANGAYPNTPGMFTDRHQRRWAEIADAVHAEGSRMFVQLVARRPNGSSRDQWRRNRRTLGDRRRHDRAHADGSQAASRAARPAHGRTPRHRRGLPRRGPPCRRRRNGRRRDPFGQRLSAARVSLRRDQPPRRHLRRHRPTTVPG